MSVRLMSERDLVRAVMRKSPDADDALNELALRSVRASDDWRQDVADLRFEFMGQRA